MVIIIYIMSIKGVLISFMKENAYKPMTVKELAKILDISEEDATKHQEKIRTAIKESTLYEVNLE